MQITINSHKIILDPKEHFYLFNMAKTSGVEYAQRVINGLFTNHKAVDADEEMVYAIMGCFERDMKTYN